MKMAKIQKATLDPTKISGRCGRLKCCLRYEYDTYTGMQKELPPSGSLIVTNNGQATVLGQEILANQLLVETEDHRRVMIDAADVLSVIRKGGGDKQRENKGRNRQSNKGKNKSGGQSSAKQTQGKDDKANPAKPKTEKQSDRNDHPNKENG
jgi:hypothetical protein